MTALFMDGFDHYGTGAQSAVNMAAGVYSAVHNVAGAPTQCAAPSWGSAATGPYCLVSLSAAPGTKANAAVYTLPASNNKVFASLRFAMDALPLSNLTTTVLSFLGSGGTLMAYLGVSTTGALVLYSAANAVIAQTAAGLVAPQTFAFLELCWDQTTTTFTLRVNDTFASLTPAMTVTNAAVGTLYSIGLVPCVDGSDPPSSFQNQYIDDFYVRDNTGTLNNSWLGDQRVAWVPVNGDTTTMAWTPTGATGGDYTTVGKSVPDDTSYMGAPAPAPMTGTMTMTTLPSHGDEFRLGYTDGPPNGGTTAIYNFVTALSGSFQILIGATIAATLTNAMNAINGGPGAGTTYGTGTTANTYVTANAVVGNTLPMVAKELGTTVDSITGTIPSVVLIGTAFSFGASTFTGGVNQAVSQFTATGLPATATKVSAAQIVKRALTTELTTTQVQAALVTPKGAVATGATSTLAQSAAVYSDVFNANPDTGGALYPLALVQSKLQIKRIA